MDAQVLFGFLITCLNTGLWRRFRLLNSEGKGQVGAMVAAVTYWFVHSSVDWFWQLPAVTLPVMVYLAMLVGPWRQVEPATAPPPRWPLRLVGVGVAVLAIAAVAPLYIADRYLEQSYSAAGPGEALAAVERAQRFNPVDPELFEEEAELAMQLGDWERAEDAYQNAIRLSPQDPRPYALLAEAHEQRDDPDAALLFYREALALNPLDRILNLQVLKLWAQIPVQRSLPVRFINEGGAELGQLNLTVADSAPESESRLQGPVTLSAGAGVLFFQSPSTDTTDPFWLKNTTAPLDVAFVGVKGKVTEIKSIDQPNEEQVIPERPYRLVIVANRQFFERNNISPKSQVVAAISS